MKSFVYISVEIEMQTKSEHKSTSKTLSQMASLLILFISHSDSTSSHSYNSTQMRCECLHWRANAKPIFTSSRECSANAYISFIWTICECMIQHE